LAFSQSSGIPIGVVSGLAAGRQKWNAILKLTSDIGIQFQLWYGLIWIKAGTPMTGQREEAK
jgi:hypothetical protein